VLRREQEAAGPPVIVPAVPAQPATPPPPEKQPAEDLSGLY
jgi:penicillin-binding protein 1A